jgi:hypothetical protein
MTSPVVQANVEVARINARIARNAAAGFGSRLLRAAGVELSAVTPAVGAQAEQTLRARLASAPKAVVAAGVTFAFSRLVAVCDMVLVVAALAERIDSIPLSSRVRNFALGPLTITTGIISDRIRSFERLPSGPGVAGLGNVSDWIRAAALFASLSGVGVVPGVALLIFAELVDAIDGLESDAAELVRAACEAQKAATGQACTPEMFATLLEQERAREEANSLSSLATRTVDKIVDTAGDIGRSAGEGLGNALFWLVLLGGAGAMLYFSAPALADRAASTAQRFRS